MYKEWKLGDAYAEVQIGWHFGVGFEVTEAPGIFLILPFVRLSLVWYR